MELLLGLRIRRLDVQWVSEINKQIFNKFLIKHVLVRIVE